MSDLKQIAATGEDDYDYRIVAWADDDTISVDAHSGDCGPMNISIPWADVLKHAPTDLLFAAIRGREGVKEVVVKNRFSLFVDPLPPSPDGHFARLQMSGGACVILAAPLFAETVIEIVPDTEESAP